jgi:hypothetical protein
MAIHAPAPRDPEPERWLTAERLQRVQDQMGQALPLLRRGGLLSKTLAYWVRTELAVEMELGSTWPEPEREEELDQLDQAWRANHNPDDWGLSDQELRRKLLVAPACRRWARQQWQHRLESLYLERKDQLDRASCRLLRVSDPHLALELFHRLRAGEDSFEALSFQYGEGPERLQGGLLPLQPLAKLPYGLAPLLPTLEVGELVAPQPLGERFAMVQLEQLEPAQLDSKMEILLLDQELNAWIFAVVNRLQALLSSAFSTEAADL